MAPRDAAEDAALRHHGEFGRTRRNAGELPGRQHHSPNSHAASVAVTAPRRSPRIRGISPESVLT
jgi:hypothetical protein